MGDQTKSTYGNFEGFPLIISCIVLVGSIYRHDPCSQRVILFFGRDQHIPSVFREAKVSSAARYRKIPLSSNRWAGMVAIGSVQKSFKVVFSCLNVICRGLRLIDFLFGYRVDCQKMQGIGVFFYSLLLPSWTSRVSTYVILL